MANKDFDKNYLITLIVSLKKYIKDYYNKINIDNAQQIIDDFNEEWEIIVNYPDDYTSNWLSRYGLALIILSTAYYKLPNTKEKDINRLSKLVKKFHKNDSFVKHIIYYNIGICWHKLGKIYDKNAIEAFKRHIYHKLTISNYDKHITTAYAFRRCNRRLYKMLSAEQLNLSSPTTFNDPFDCRIIDLLKNGTESQILSHQAYIESLKIACFTTNIKLPYPQNPKIWFSERVKNEKKQEKEEDDFINNLMWAHYADSHKGICIKYWFGGAISKLDGEDKNIVAFFKDVKYSNTDMNKYSKQNSINLEDAFFLKGDDWKYENELRFLYYNTKDHNKHRTISIPNCIEAIFFGLKCSKKDKERIIDIMKNKKLVLEYNGIIIEEPIQFYQMEFDDNNWGRLKAVKIKLEK